jgi:hypothetical protein
VAGINEKPPTVIERLDCPEMEDKKWKTLV